MSIYLSPTHRLRGSSVRADPQVSRITNRIAFARHSGGRYLSLRLARRVS